MDGFDAVKVIDGNQHLMGRLAATVAKCLLQGKFDSFTSNRVDFTSVF